MILSRLVLNHNSKAVRRDLASRYEMHRTLARALAGQTDRGLWRVVTPSSGPNEILLQSQHQPDIAAILEREESHDYLSSHEAREWYPDRVLQTDACYRFFLEANPTCAQSVEGQRSKRVGVRTTSAQYQWLARQGVQHGFELLGCLVRDSEVHRIARAGKPMTILGVNYEGHLKITDRVKFLKALQGGLGRARGFGFGLLSLGR